MDTTDVICYLNGFFTNTYDKSIVLNEHQKMCIMNVIEQSQFDEYCYIIDYMYIRIKDDINLYCEYWGKYVRDLYVVIEKLSSKQVTHLLEGFLDNKLTTTKPYQHGFVLFSYDEAFYYVEQFEKCDDLGLILNQFSEILYEFINGASYDDMLNITEPIITLFN